MNSYRQILGDGLWHNNQALVALLGLCPLLAVSNTVINALGMGLATTLTLMLTNLGVSILRRTIAHEIRIPIFVLIIASVVTVVELLMQAWLFDLYLVLGIFVPLIVTNCSVIARAEAFAYKNSPLRAMLDGLAVGLGFTLALFLLGALRELVGYGTLLRQAELMFGAAAVDWEIKFAGDYRGFLLFILPAGAFFGLSFLVAMKNGIDHLAQQRVKKPAAVTHPARWQQP